MDRRSFLKAFAGAGSLAASGAFPAPAVSQGAAAKTLRFVPQANLANFDPIWGTQYVVRNASQLVWDTLYGMDSKLQAQRRAVRAAARRGRAAKAARLAAMLRAAQAMWWMPSSWMWTTRRSNSSMHIKSPALVSIEAGFFLGNKL